MKKICLFIMFIVTLNALQVTAISTIKYSNEDFILENSLSDEFDMVIISRNIFKSTLQPLIEHKNSHGLKTFYKDVEEIYDEYQGRDKPEKIKYFIKNTIETNGISSVLIIGGIDLIPIRYTYIYQKTDDISYSVVTDSYYADIYNSTEGFCSWDSNNDNIFSQLKYDEVDLYPDVNVGRIPCYETNELEIIIDKIINYENFSYGSDWFNRILYLSDWYDEELSENLSQEMEKSGFASEKLYPSKNTYSIKKINSETTKGAGFISFKGHGSEKGITIVKQFYRPIINWTFAYPIKYKNRHLKDMNNGYKLPIAFFDACLTGMPDIMNFYHPMLYKIFKIPNKAGFAYNIIKKEGGGAIAAIGASRLSTGNIEKGADFLHYHFFINYKPGITLGEMYAASIKDHLDKSGNDHMVKEIIEKYNIIGDPSLKVGGYP